MWRLWFYPLLIGIGVGTYYGVGYLPASWQEWLRGRKTHIVGWLGIVGPEFLDTLMQAQALGLHEYLGETWAKVFSQIVGVLAIAARLRTDTEKADA